MRLRTFMSSKIHKATVTEANLDYVGSNTSGARLETYIIEGEHGSDNGWANLKQLVVLVFQLNSPLPC